MEHLKCFNAGTLDNVSRIALGTAQFGLDYGISNKSGQTSPAELEKILDLASASGVNCLDTAIQYGNSESNLGKSNLDEFIVVSKFPLLAPSDIRDALLGSLKRLNLHRLYGFLGHSFDALNGQPEVWDELSQLKEDGLVTKVGCSLYSPNELEALLEQKVPLDMIQIPYNVLDRRFEYLFPELESQNIEVHTRSAFLQGLLLMESDGLSQHFEPIKRFLQSFDQIVSPYTRAEYLLNWCLRSPAVSKVVIGVNNSAQLAANLSALERPLKEIPDIPIPSVSDEIILPTRWPKCVE